MPRPASAGVPVKSAEAARAGGKPTDSCDGGRPPLPLFTPAATTTATPTAMATVIGMNSPVIRLRPRIVVMTSRNREVPAGPAGGADTGRRSGAATGADAGGRRGWARGDAADAASRR